MATVRVLLVSLTALVMTAVVPAAADPIPITTGSITVSGFARGSFRSISFSLADGEAFAASGLISDTTSEPRVPPCSQFSPCGAGATTDPTNTYSVSNALGSATLNGTFYPEVLYRGTSDFILTGGDVVLPSTTDETIALLSPFVFEGTTSIWAIGASDTPTFVGDFALTGQGTATTRLQRFGSGYAISGFTYQFAGPSASPTPEPASLLLLASGVVIAVRRWRHA